MLNRKDIALISTEAAIEAGKAILEIYSQSDIEIDLKKDKSPLTAADLASNAVINRYLKRTPYPIISEENKQLEYEVRRNWEIYWIVDPLDGTKEFIKKNGEFTVNIALCTNGNPIFGIIYVPVTKELYFGDVDNSKAYKVTINEEIKAKNDFFIENNRIYPRKKKGSTIRVVGSRSHMNQETLNYVESLRQNGKDVEIVSKGSSLKFCLVAEGEADVYPRFAPTMEWDTAAGQAICNAVGLNVYSQETQKNLCYNKENLLNPYFLVTP